MSCILYYSNYCEHSKKLLQTFSKTNMTKDIHFICIDKRVKESNKTFIILENGQKMIMPENVTRVPALLLLNEGYNVIYGESILQYFKPKQQMNIREATNNNLEPMAFSLNGGMIVSDNYSFLDMDADALSAKGDGGIRQMHNYVELNFTDHITTPADDHDYKSSKLSGDISIEKLQSQREQDFQKITGDKKFNI